MDKRKLVATAAKKTDYAKWEVNKIVDALLESVTDELQQGEEVYLKGFGRFKLKVRKARDTFHPQSKEPIHIVCSVSTGGRFSADLSWFR